MKKMIFTTLAISSILVSCGQEKASIDNSGYKNKIVLGAFNDIVSASTLNESQLQNLPKVVDLSADMTPSRNQSDRGTCTYFSTMGVVEATIKKDLGIEVNLSEEYMNYTSKLTGAFASGEGSNIMENIKAMYSGGLLLEDDWSYQASWFSKGLPCSEYKSSDSAAPKICFSHNAPNMKALERRINAQNIVFYTLNKNTTEVIKFLATKKRPLTMSVNVNFKGWPNSGETTYSEELRNECLSSSKCGGHSVVLTGYDMNKKVFMFKNSWGKDWGKQGFGTIPFDVVDKYVSGVFYYAEVKGDVVIPQPQNLKLKVAKFDVSASAKKDKSIDVSIDSYVEETSGKMLLISSYLVKKSKTYAHQLPTDSNTELVRIYGVEDQKKAGDEYARILVHTLPEEENEIVIKPTDVTGMTLPSSMLSIPVIANLMGSSDYDTALRTTIYVHNDDVGFKVLKRIYSPLK